MSPGRGCNSYLVSSQFDMTAVSIHAAVLQDHIKIAQNVHTAEKNDISPKLQVIKKHAKHSPISR
jgi:hypothetical protein